MGSKIKIRVDDRDRGWDRLRRTIFKPESFATVGVHGEDDSRKDGQIGNVELMTVHEFGTERAGRNRNTRIPERSVIRYTIDKYENAYKRLLSDVGGKVYELAITAKQALEIVGLKAAADMRETIDRTPGGWEALKESTLRSRQYGGTKPLLDRSELKRSIKHKVLA